MNVNTWRRRFAIYILAGLIAGIGLYQVVSYVYAQVHPAESMTLADTGPTGRLYNATKTSEGILRLGFLIDKPAVPVVHGHYAVYGPRGFHFAVEDVNVGSDQTVDIWVPSERSGELEPGDWVTLVLNDIDGVVLANIGAEIVASDLDSIGMSIVYGQPGQRCGVIPITMHVDPTVLVSMPDLPVPYSAEFVRVPEDTTVEFVVPEENTFEIGSLPPDKQTLDLVIEAVHPDDEAARTRLVYKVPGKYFECRKPATATPTPTQTPTETKQDTPTPVPTDTPKDTPTPTATATGTKVPTTVPTATETPTGTHTPVPEKPTETPSATPTPKGDVFLPVIVQDITPTFTPVPPATPALCTTRKMRVEYAGMSSNIDFGVWPGPAYANILLNIGVPITFTMVDGRPVEGSNLSWADDYQFTNYGPSWSFVAHNSQGNPRIQRQYWWNAWYTDQGVLCNLTIPMQWDPPHTAMAAGVETMTIRGPRGLEVVVPIPKK